MSKDRHYKLPVVLQIILIALILGGVLVVLNCFRIRIVAFKDRAHIERWTGLDLSDVPDATGYFAKGKDLYSWIRFDVTNKALDAFLARNDLVGKLVKDQRSIKKARSLANPAVGKVRVDGWISIDFTPTLAFNGERISILVGKRYPESSVLTVYICKF